MPATKGLLNVRKNIKIQPHQLSPTKLKPDLAFSDLHEYIFLVNPRALGHTIACKATRDSSIHIKRVRDNVKKPFGYRNCWHPFLPLLQPIRHAQTGTGTLVGRRVKQLLVHLLVQRRLWSWLHHDASLAGKKGRQETCCVGYSIALAAAAYFFPASVVTLIVNDKGNLHSVWFPAHIWILYKAPLFLPLLPLPSSLPFLW